MKTIIPLEPNHARAAATLHMAGQPGTFLTSLGQDVLSAIYAALPRTKSGFGYAAVDNQGHVSGFISAATGVGALFIEIGIRHARHLFLPLLARFVRRPSLAIRSVQTLLYPMMAGGERSDEEHRVAELLSIMVKPDCRGQGTGGLLLQSLVNACQRRQIAWLDVTVDGSNSGARRFYERHAFFQQKSFTLYGRKMVQYRRSVEGLSGG